MPSNSVEMRGLSTFITDLRNCRSVEQEEKRVNKELGHIRQKFKAGNLSGYDRKKYVSKLLYMFILGYKVDFGHVEAVNLIASSKFKEKQMGYLAVTLFMNEGMDAIHLVVNSFKKDLEVELEHVNCLVLHAIANIGGAILADTLASDVFQKVISSRSPFVQKKALFCLLKLYRKAPDSVFPSHSVSEWLPPLYRLVQQAPLDVVLAATTLAVELAKENPSLFVHWVAWALASLHNLFFQQAVTEKEMYYRVPAPWLVIKLLNLLRIVSPTPPELNSAIEGMSALVLMDQLVQAILNHAKEALSKKHTQYINAILSVLVEALHVMVLWNPTSDHWSAVIHFLAKELPSKALHLRYIAMELYGMMLNQQIQTVEIRSHKAFIRQACHDRDISIRRQAIDVLYAMCDSELGPAVVETFLEQLKTAEVELKQVLVTKIMTLAEKFRPNFRWYFQTMCELVPNAGEAGHRIWYPIAHQVLREQGPDLIDAIHLALKTLESTTNETMIQLCVYLVSEHAELLSSPIQDVFHLVLNVFHQCSDTIKPLFLTCFLKFGKHAPALVNEVTLVYQQYVAHIDIDLQERAYLYLILLQSPPSTLQHICNHIPPMPLQSATSVSTPTSAISPSSTVPNSLSAFPTKEISTLTSKQQLARFYFSNEGVLFENSQLQLGAQLRIIHLEGRIECMLYVGNRSSTHEIELSFQVSKPNGVEVVVQPSLLRVNASVQERVLVTVHLNAFPLTSPMYLECSGSVSMTIVLPVFSMQFAEFAKGLDSFSELSQAWSNLSPQSMVAFPWIPVDQLQAKLRKLHICSFPSNEGWFLVTQLKLPSFQCMILAYCKPTAQNWMVEVRSEYPSLHSSFLDAFEAAIQVCNESKEDTSALLGLF